MIFYLLNSVLFIGLFIDMLERRFPNEFNNFMMKSSFNCIYFYSNLQIKLVRINNNFNKFIERERKEYFKKFSIFKNIPFFLD